MESINLILAWIIVIVLILSVTVVLTPIYTVLYTCLEITSPFSSYSNAHCENITIWSGIESRTSTWHAALLASELPRSTPCLVWAFSIRCEYRLTYILLNHILHGLTFTVQLAIINFRNDYRNYWNCNDFLNAFSNFCVLISLYLQCLLYVFFYPEYFFICVLTFLFH